MEKTHLLDLTNSNGFERIYINENDYVKIRFSSEEESENITFYNKLEPRYSAYSPNYYEKVYKVSQNFKNVKKQGFLLFYAKLNNFSASVYVNVFGAECITIVDPKKELEVVLPNLTKLQIVLTDVYNRPNLNPKSLGIFNISDKSQLALDRFELVPTDDLLNRDKPNYPIHRFYKRTSQAHYYFYPSIEPQPGLYQSSTIQNDNFLIKTFINNNFYEKPLWNQWIQNINTKKLLKIHGFAHNRFIVGYDYLKLNTYETELVIEIEKEKNNPYLAKIKIEISGCRFEIRELEDRIINYTTYQRFLLKYFVFDMSRIEKNQIICNIYFNRENSSLCQPITIDTIGNCNSINNYVYSNSCTNSIKEPVEIKHTVSNVFKIAKPNIILLEISEKLLYPKYVFNKEERIEGIVKDGDLIRFRSGTNNKIRVPRRSKWKILYSPSFVVGIMHQYNENNFTALEIATSSKTVIKKFERLIISSEEKTINLMAIIDE